MPTDPLTGSRYPDSSYSAAIWTWIEQAVKDLSDNTNTVYATTAARDTAFAAWVAAGNTMRDGLEAWCNDTGKWLRANNAWVLILPKTFAHFQGYRSTAQSIPNNTDTTVTWNAEFYDTTSSHAASGTTFVAPYTGFFRAQASIGFVENATGIRHIFMRLDGTNVNGTAETSTPQQSIVPQLVTTPLRRIYMTVGQTLDVRVKQTSGGALDTTFGAGATSGLFEVVWDGPI